MRKTTNLDSWRDGMEPSRGKAVRKETSMERGRQREQAESFRMQQATEVKTWELGLDFRCGGHRVSTKDSRVNKLFREIRELRKEWSIQGKILGHKNVHLRREKLPTMWEETERFRPGKGSERSRGEPRNGTEEHQSFIYSWARLLEFLFERLLVSLDSFLPQHALATLVMDSDGVQGCFRQAQSMPGSHPRVPSFWPPLITTLLQANTVFYFTFLGTT